MANYGDLQTRIQNLLIDTPAFVAGEVAQYINDAIFDLQTHNFQTMHTEATWMTTAGSNVLTPSISGFKEWAEQPVRIDPYGSVQPMVYGLSAREESLRDNGRQGSPAVIYLGEPNDFNVRSVLIAPTADAFGLHPNGAYQVRAWYWRYLPDLTDPSDQNFFTNDRLCAQYIINQSVYRGYDAIQDEQRAMRWEPKAIAAKAQAILADKRRVLAAAQTLPSFYPVNAPRTQR